MVQVKAHLNPSSVRNCLEYLSILMKLRNRFGILVFFANRAYIFDNSTHEHIWLAEITDGHLLEMKTDQVPAWFKKALGSKFDIKK